MKIDYLKFRSESELRDLLKKKKLRREALVNQLAPIEIVIRDVKEELKRRGLTP